MGKVGLKEKNHEFLRRGLHPHVLAPYRVYIQIVK